MIPANVIILQFTDEILFRNVAFCFLYYDCQIYFKLSMGLMN